MAEKKYGQQQGTKTSDTAKRYQAAVELYRTTTLSVKAICEQTQTSFGGFRAYLIRCHRDLLFARHGITLSKEEAETAKLRQSKGQTAAAHAKYKDAIRACDDSKYIELNVSQIAHTFHVSPVGLSNQLRNHYPEVLARREKERHRLGINDNLHRGVKRWCKEQYAEAVEHLRTTNDTIRQTADLYQLSYPGLREHLLSYYKDLIDVRADKRRRAKETPHKERGALTGTGARHEPTAEHAEKYREAVELYRTTALTQEEIAEATGVNLSGLRNHLRIWHRDLMRERHDVDGTGTGEMKRYLKSTAAKYAEAIERLKTTDRPTAEVAKEFGLHPEVFREYLHEHEPELAARQGMTQLANGKRVSARSTKKYEEAVRLYETTTEPLKSIAQRLGIPYNSVGGFVRRNCPDAIEAHNRLLEQEELSKREQAEAAAAAELRQQEEEERKRILQALQQANGNKRQAARMLGISQTTLYSRLNAWGLAEEKTPAKHVQKTS